MNRSRDLSPTALASRIFVFLPLVLLAVMVALGLVLEITVLRRVLWVSKVPIALLLGAALLPPRRRTPS